jgi:hypothetical protein
MEINPGQILSIALASVPTMLTVLVGILINNSRLGDVNSRIGDVNSRIDDVRSQMDSRIGDQAPTCIPLSTRCAPPGNPNCAALRKFLTPASSISKSVEVGGPY